MYKKFVTHAKKVARDISIENDRPILEGIMHYVNGDAAATDSHRLYYVKGIHDKAEGVYTAAGKKLEGDYPDVSRLFPSDFPYQAVYKLDDLITGVDIILTAAKYSEEEYPVIEFLKDKFFYKNEEAQISASYGLDPTLDIEIFSNAHYWMDALKMFKAFKYEELQLSIQGPMRPFTFTSLDERLTALILPVRRYS